MAFFLRKQSEVPGIQFEALILSFLVFAGEATRSHRPFPVNAR
jgi:hypothetical protein